ncbi:hypothetical protein DdX_11062 [Ditylenchus destructor]|uniref:Uncharacterized protein n=1 Tax=Ditylenchus destructor TaxID=166010 RepID=A0AAD4MWN7_9BILA|nr:hypothetical protein DdX_11062 [Ditylenchus destructor]
MLVEENGTRNSAKLEEIAAEIENFGKTENLKAFGNEIDAWFNKVTQMLDPKSASNLSGKFLVGVQTQQQNTVKVDPKANTSQSQPVVKKEKTKLTVVIPPVKAPPSHQRPPSKVQPAPVPLTTTNDPQNGNAEVKESLPSPASNAAYYTPSSGSPNQIPSPFQSANSPNFVPPNIDASTFGLQTSNAQQAIRVQHARVAQEHVEFSTNSEADGSDNSKADMTRALWN